MTANGAVVEWPYSNKRTDSGLISGKARTEESKQKPKQEEADY